MKASLKVHIADDHPLVVEGLKAVLRRTAPDIAVTGEAADGRAALELARRRPADIYVYDISMPPPDGLQTMVALLKAQPSARVIILSMHDDRATVQKALRLGASGYLAKESAVAEITAALRAVAGGIGYLSPSLAALAAPAPRQREPGEILTSKEREVVGLLAKGLCAKEIAGRLGISPQTVNVHRRNISNKLNIRKQTDLVRYAIREGLARL